MENDILIKGIKALLKIIKSDSFYTEYGEGFKAGKIEALETILKLIVK